jgi:uncharacterized membrane protein (DUF106 family)
MPILTRVILWLNGVVKLFFGLLEKPISVLPLWLSLVILSVMLGVLMSIVFKYTSNQTALSRVRDRIKAHLLSMKLFRDNIPVILRSQVKILGNVFLLLAYSLVPMLVMILPVSLFLGWLGLWYQLRPLAKGDTAVVMIQFADFVEDTMPTVVLEASDAVVVDIGPVHVPSKRQIYWQIQTQKEGYHQLTLRVEGHPVQKELAVGASPMSVSALRTSPDWLAVLLHPAEEPFDKTLRVQSIRINYPHRPSALTGTDNWLISLLVISMATFLLCKSLFNIKC